LECFNYPLHTKQHFHDEVEFTETVNDHGTAHKRCKTFVLNYAFSSTSTPMINRLSSYNNSLKQM